MPVKTKLTDLIARCRNSPNLNPPSRRSQPSSFLDLPLELRQQIYRYVLVSPDIIRAKFLCRRWLPDDFWLYATRDTSIFLASRQVSAEALDVFYGDNVFQVPLHGGEENVFHRLSEACRQRIRRLELITIPVAIPYGKKSQLKLDDRYWPSVLADLTELRLVAQGPKTQFYYYDTGPFRAMQDDWERWLKPVFEYIDRHIPSGLAVQIDDNKMDQTSELAKQCLTRGVYKNVQTKTGDFVFKRGKFSR